MKQDSYYGQLKVLVDKAIDGNPGDVDFIINHLTTDSTLAMTRFVDFALSLIINKEGVTRIEYYLFNGTLIQRNYASLYFNRIGDWDTVKKAFELGLIDEIQAFAR